MAHKKEQFKEAKREYLAAIKDGGKALIRAFKDPDTELSKYSSFRTKEEDAQKAYRRAANALLKSLHPSASRKQR